MVPCAHQLEISFADIVDLCLSQIKNRAALVRDEAVWIFCCLMEDEHKECARKAQIQDQLANAKFDIILPLPDKNFLNYLG